MEAEWKNRKARRAGEKEIPPLYTLNDAAGVINLLEGYEYDEIVELNDDITLRFIDAGHLLGSASIEVWCREGEKTRKIVFSGDIGNINKPLIRDPQYIRDADYVVMECTYGDRSHPRSEEHVEVQGTKKTIIQLQYGVGTKHLIFLQWKKLQKFIKKIIKM